MTTLFIGHNLWSLVMTHYLLVIFMVNVGTDRQILTIDVFRYGINVQQASLVSIS